MKLKDYISGKREGEEANRLEQDALNNPFLHDAIDGYDAFEENHLPTLESLEKELDKRINKLPDRHFIRIKMIWIAASVALFIGIGSFFMLRNPGMEREFIASDGTTVKEDSVVINSEEHLPVSVENREDDSLHIEILSDDISTSLIADHHSVPDKHLEKGKIPLPDKDNADKTEMIEDVPVIVSEIQGHIQIDSVFSDNRLEGLIAGAHSSKEKKDQRILSAVKKIGQVLDEFGEPMIGVNVLIEGTNIGTVTDLDGRFALTIPPDMSNNKLIASYLGYEPHEFAPPAGNELAYVHLEPSTSTLDEVVVIGYGTQKKSSITGSVSQVKGKKDKFAKRQFKSYLAENINVDLCEEKVVKVSVKFYLDETGTPTNIQVSKNPSDCEALDDEIIYWLENSPKWTKRNKHIRLRLKIRFK